MLCFSGLLRLAPANDDKTNEENVMAKSYFEVLWMEFPSFGVAIARRAAWRPFRSAQLSLLRCSQK
ncbi:MAG: hypothetical protein LBR10_14005 [Prevotellaceae bacterium]|nr:hypothetical protein [Prevotellaceae bacterium]